jgi:isopenicillin N synthase-like dioxygenase
MTSATDFESIPVIDVAPLYRDDPAAARVVAADIRRASAEVGFFYVKGHAVPHDLMRATLMAAKYFFAQPDAAKRAIQVNRAHRGYVPFAQSTLGRQYKADLKESFNFAFPFAADDPGVLAGKPLIGVNQWPGGEDAWREVVEDYYRSVFEVGQRVLEGFALALEAPRDYFRGLYKRPLVRTRLLHYPPQPEGAGADQFGAAPHTDWGCMTLLWQDQVGGLQVRNRSGQWIAAPYIEGTFVVNIGDMLERWSNELFVSTPHRVVNASGRERYSIPMFYDPDFDTVVECLPNCSGPDNPPKFPRTIAGEYITAKYDDAYAYRKQSASQGQ